MSRVGGAPGEGTRALCEVVKCLGLDVSSWRMLPLSFMLSEFGMS